MATTGQTLTSDGTRLSWRLEGSGPAVVLCNGIANDAFQWGSLRAALRGRASVLTWDYRGHGQSAPARDPDTLQMSDIAGDLQAVINDVLGPDEPLTLIGFSMGCQVATAAWPLLQSQARALVAILGPVGRPFDNFFGGGLPGRAAHALLRRTPPPVIGAVLRLVAAGGPIPHATSRLIGIVERDLQWARFAPFMAHLGRLDPASFRAMALAAQAHDGRDILPRVHAPALVVAGGRDLFAPPNVCAAVAKSLRQAELLTVAEAAHSGMVGRDYEITPAVVDFLTRHRLVTAAT